MNGRNGTCSFLFFVSTIFPPKPSAVQGTRTLLFPATPTRSGRSHPPVATSPQKRKPSTPDRKALRTTARIDDFKALANGNGSSNGHSSNASTPREGEGQRTRRAVRSLSYLSSREIFEPARPPFLTRHHVVSSSPILAGGTFSHPSAGAASASA
ncbi:hypothetical protein EDB85DRAFT_1061445 [Lactarius pseudohatsudake]|nr:hypothetical protein EDB85DRAFT_1061445 [Lactarius pseudohatsudake]